MTAVSLLFTQVFLALILFYLDVNQKSESGSEVAQSDDSSPTQDQSQQQSSQPKAACDGSQVSGSDGLRKLEPPDLADRSSQSSFTSQDGTGKHLHSTLELSWVYLSFLYWCCHLDVWMLVEYNERIRNKKTTEQESKNQIQRCSKEVRQSGGFSN